MLRRPLGQKHNLNLYYEQYLYGTDVNLLSYLWISKGTNNMNRWINRLDKDYTQCSWACLGQKKWHQRSVNGFFHQFIYSVWKVETQNLTLGALGDSQNGSFYLVNALGRPFSWLLLTFCLLDQSKPLQIIKVRRVLRTRDQGLSETPLTFAIWT